MKLLDESASSRPPSRAPLLLGIAALAILAGAAAWFWSARPAEPPPATAPAPAPSETPSTAREPATGMIEVVADRPGAVVILDGQRLGPAPATARDVPAGAHRVRVELEGVPAIEREVNVLPGRSSRVDARFGAAPPRLRVTADVPGASVFLDREFVGRTPLAVDVAEGRYSLQVSAEGLPPHTETVELVGGDVTARHVLLNESPALEASVAVEHKHGFGSCQGVLHASDAGLRYETDHKDAFSVALDDVERFELDYLDENLELKVRGGRRYNFRGEPDALLVFHRQVQGRLAD